MRPAHSLMSHSKNRMGGSRNLQIQLFRIVSSGARVPDIARTSDEFFRGLLQPAPRAYAANFLAPSEFGALRSARLDDHRPAALVHRRIPVHHPPLPAAEATDGETPASS